MVFTKLEKEYIKFINSRIHVSLGDYILEKYKDKGFLDPDKFEYNGIKYNNFNTKIINISEEEKDNIFSEVVCFYCFCESLYSENLVGKIEIEKTPEIFFGIKVIFDINSNIDLNRFLIDHGFKLYFPRQELKELKNNDYKTKYEEELTNERDQRIVAEKRTRRISIIAIIVPAILIIIQSIFGIINSGRTIKVEIMNSNVLDSRINIENIDDIEKQQIDHQDSTLDVILDQLNNNVEFPGEKVKEK